ncbi:MAG: hypothetical protein DYG94_01465 [Leptolyngbya sp. PLA3]|nr:MAG: hypothetical protein EDM82_00415 [Cyanobacteria bacterium CYA]MCE7967399.1 hypothetical protein [Leptolyngbya sp. PL-A3]
MPSNIVGKIEFFEQHLPDGAVSPTSIRITAAHSGGTSDRTNPFTILFGTAGGSSGGTAGAGG